MKKRIVGMLLILALLFSVCDAAVIGADAAQTASIKVGGKTFSVKVGDYFEYKIAFTYPGNRLATAQVELPVDFSGLSGYSQKEIKTHLKRIAPVTADASVVQRFGGSSQFQGYVMNFVSPGGFDFKTKKNVLTLIFGVEKAGEYQLAAKVRYIDDVKDKTVADGKYQIKDSRFSYSESVADYRFDAPQVGASAVASGVKVSWKPVPKVSLYRVYRKSGDKWVKLADTASTSLTDTKVKNGAKYTYTVRNLSADASHTLGDYDHKGKTAAYYTAPVLKLRSAVNGVDIKWDAVRGVSKYRVYSWKNGGWKKLADTTGTSLVDKAVSSGKKYRYTIRTMDKNGSYLSHYYTDGFAVTYIAAPTVRLSNTADGVKISWNKVGGAEKYRVFVRGADGWVKLKDTAGTSFVSKNVKHGKTYAYTVRCISADGKKNTGGFTAGGKITFYKPIKLTLSGAKNGVALKWGAVKGASKYRIYRKTKSGWSKLADTASAPYVDTAVKAGKTYCYTIRALDKKGNYLNYYYTDGFKITYQTK